MSPVVRNEDTPLLERRPTTQQRPGGGWSTTIKSVAVGALCVSAGVAGTLAFTRHGHHGAGVASSALGAAKGGAKVEHLGAKKASIEDRISALEATTAKHATAIKAVAQQTVKHSTAIKAVAGEAVKHATAIKAVAGEAKQAKTAANAAASTASGAAGAVQATLSNTETKVDSDVSNDVSKTENQARSIHWSPYDRVGVVNADP
jgi:hypothetical protein